MELELCVLNERAHAAACAAFRDLMEEQQPSPHGGAPRARVRVLHSSITAATHAALVAPGNSFGEMNGGADGAINTHLSAFGAGYVQEHVKAAIEARWGGELPVGAAVVVRTAHPRHTHLVYAPTMRVASALDAGTTLNPYLALRGALLAALDAGVTALSAPLFCTGAGGVAPERACAQMRAAYDSVFGAGAPQTRWQWPELHARHRQLLAAGEAGP
jgi:O-acetyl-ADP-ribose deacetylase (regulator of RNase III)